MCKLVVLGKWFALSPHRQKVAGLIPRLGAFSVAALVGCSPVTSLVIESGWLDFCVVWHWKESTGDTIIATIKVYYCGFFCHLSLLACTVSTFGCSRPFNVRTRDFIMRTWCAAWSCNKILTWRGKSGVVEQAQLAQLNRAGNIVGKPPTAFETAQIIVCKKNKKLIKINWDKQTAAITPADRSSSCLECEILMSNWKMIKCKFKEQKEFCLMATWAETQWRHFNMAANRTLSCWNEWPWLLAEGKHVCIQQQFCNLASSQSEAFTLRKSLSPTCSCAGRSLLLISRDQQCLLYSTCKHFCYFYLHRCDLTGLFLCSYWPFAECSS